MDLFLIACLLSAGLCSGCAGLDLRGSLGTSLLLLAAVTTTAAITRAVVPVAIAVITIASAITAIGACRCLAGCFGTGGGVLRMRWLRLLTAVIRTSAAVIPLTALRLGLGSRLSAPLGTLASFGRLGASIAALTPALISTTPAIAAAIVTTAVVGASLVGAALLGGGFFGMPFLCRTLIATAVLAAPFLSPPAIIAAGGFPAIAIGFGAIGAPALPSTFLGSQVNRLCGFGIGKVVIIDVEIILLVDEVLIIVADVAGVGEVEECILGFADIDEGRVHPLDHALNLAQVN